MLIIEADFAFAVRGAVYSGGVALTVFFVAVTFGTAAPSYLLLFDKVSFGLEAVGVFLKLFFDGLFPDFAIEDVPAVIAAAVFAANEAGSEAFAVHFETFDFLAFAINL